MADIITNQDLQKPQQRQGSGFVNLQRMLQANQPGRLGQAVGSGLQKEAQRTQQTIGQAGQEFRQQAEASRLDKPETQQYVQQTLQDPTKASEADIKRFEEIRAGQYKGPKELQNYGQIASQAQATEGLGRMASTGAGRGTLLQRYVGGDRYTTGQRGLDQLVLGAGGTQPLQQARRQALGLGREAETQQLAAQTYGQELGQRAQEFGRQTIGQIGQTIEEKQAAIEAQLPELQRQREQQVAEAGQRLQSGREVTQEDLQRLGLTAGTRLYNVDLSKFLTAGAGPKAEEVASAEDYARFRALSQLGGRDITGQAAQAIETFRDPTKAGSFFKRDPYEVQQTELKREVQKQEDAYNAAMQDLANMEARIMANDPEAYSILGMPGHRGTTGFTQIGGGVMYGDPFGAYMQQQALNQLAERRARTEQQFNINRVLQIAGQQPAIK